MGHQACTATFSLIINTDILALKKPLYLNFRPPHSSPIFYITQNRWFIFFSQIKTEALIWKSFTFPTQNIQMSLILIYAFLFLF